jgi:uncharacterized protein (TIGR02996 family)
MPLRYPTGGGTSVEDDGFIQAVFLAPHDDVCRLIYADWLEERGDVRGEFLRAESDLRRTNTRDTSYPVALKRWLDLRDRVPAGWLDSLGWRVNGLLLPQPFVDLLASARWEKKEFCPGGNLDWVYAYSQQEMRSETSNVCGMGWWGKPDTEHPPGDIDCKLTVMIADQGSGSDAPFALDYRASFGQPRVLLYRWRVAHDPSVPPTEVGNNRWVEVASDFSDFWHQIGNNPRGAA